MRRAQAKQKVNVIGDAAHRFGNDLQCPNYAAKVSVKTRSPVRQDKRTLMLGAENGMAMKAEMR